VSGDVELDPDQQRIFSEGVAAIQAGPAHAMPEKYDFTLFWCYRPTSRLLT
jgi:hypothetical protein